jgi:PAS domain S-box-containing protein
VPLPGRFEPHDGSRDLFLALFHQTLEPLFLLDADARLEIANRPAEQITGYTTAELREMETEETVRLGGGPLSRETLRERLHALPPGHADILEVTHTRRDGTVIPLELTMRRFEHDGRVRFLVTATDVSARHRRAHRDELILSVAKRFVREPLDAAADTAMAQIGAFLDLSAMQIRDPPGPDGDGRPRAAWSRDGTAARQLAAALAARPAEVGPRPTEARSWTVGDGSKDGADAPDSALTLISAPVIGESGAVAEVIMSRTVAEGARWDDEDRRLLTVLCEVYALALSRLRERALRTDSETRLETFTRNLPGGVWRCILDPDQTLRCTFFSGETPGFPDIRAESVVANPDILLDTVHPQDRADMLASLHQSSRVGGDWAREFRVVDPAGEIRWMHSLAKPTPLPDGGVAWDGITLDITARKRSEQALRESEQRFRTAFNEAADGMALISPAGRCLRVNQSLAGLLGVAPDDMVATAVGTWTAPAQGRILARLRLQARLTPNRILQAEVRARGNGGRRPWVRIKAAPVFDDDAGALLYWVAHVQDISAQRITQTLLVHARDQAEASARAKSEFLAMMSHEIRTPLAGMIGLARLLQDDRLDPLALRRAGRIESAGRLLLGLIDDILTLSKAEAGGLSLAREPFSADSLISEVLALLTAGTDLGGLRLGMAVGADLPGKLLGPAPATRQVLFNLVGNAVKFTPAGRIVVRASLQADGNGAPRAVRFDVEDTGVGIDPADQAMVFEAFTQGRRGRPITGGPSPIRGGGVGLGLALCQRMVEAMGGDIGLDSAPGRGSRFWFTVPVDPVSPDGATSIPGPGPAGAFGASDDAADHAHDEGGPRFAGIRVIVVDDDTLSREVQDATLSHLGCDCLSLHDGTALLEAAAAGRLGAVDLILMDLNMPGLSGEETARRLRAMGPPWRETPVLGITAGGPLPAVGNLDGCLFKPLDVGTLSRTLERLSTGDRPFFVSTPPAPSGAPGGDQVLDRTLWARRLATLGAERMAARLDELERGGAGLRAWAGGGPAPAAEDAEAVAHRIRGAAAMLGAPPLARAAGALEDALHLAAPGPAQAPEALRSAYAEAWDLTMAACRADLRAALPSSVPNPKFALFFGKRQTNFGFDQDTSK